MLIDPRFHDLAKGLTGFSTKLKRGERVLIDAFDVPDEIVVALVRAARSRGATPYVNFNHARVTRELLFSSKPGDFEAHAAVELKRPAFF